MPSGASTPRHGQMERRANPKPKRNPHSYSSYCSQIKTASIPRTSAPPGARRLETIPILQTLLLGGRGSKHPNLCRVAGGGEEKCSDAESIPDPNPNPAGVKREGNHNLLLSQDGRSGGEEEGEIVFQLSMTRHLRDAVVGQVVTEFGLNPEQSTLLWRCARWFRPAGGRGERGDDATDGKEGEGGRGCRQEENDVGCWHKVSEERGPDARREKELFEPVVLVHGVFGAGKSLALVALCVMLDRLCLRDEKARRTHGLPPRTKEGQARVLVAAGTNVAVDRVLTGLVDAGFTDIARVGSHRRVHRSLLPWVVNGPSPGKDIKQSAEKDLSEVLRGCSSLEEREWVKQALDGVRREGFTVSQARRLAESRITGVTCASSTLPFLTRPPQRRRLSAGHTQSRGGVRGLGGLLSRQGRGQGRKGGEGGGGEGGRGYDIVLLDECSQLVEPVSLLPLVMAQPRRLVLVGDPMQLPPAVAHAKVVADIEEGEEGTYSQPLTNSCSTPTPPPLPLPHTRRPWGCLPPGGRSEENCLEKTMFVRLARLGLEPLLLGRQYRCHPTMSRLASRLFYQGRLSDGIKPIDRPPIIPKLAPLTLLDIAGRGAESIAAGGSVFNSFEAKAVADIVARLLSGLGAAVGVAETSGRSSSSSSSRAGDSGKGILSAAQVGVICLYKAQVGEVRRQLESLSMAPRSSVPVRKTGAEGSEGTAGPRVGFPRDVQVVSTVDAFQGAEKDVIILASTRTERLGFIVSPQRLCVALTRARHHLIVIGERRTLLTNPLWKEVVEAADVIQLWNKLEAE
ncbi:unnamed protein product [Discosporangium mesarthrocarpum]